LPEYKQMVVDGERLRAGLPAYIKEWEPQVVTALHQPLPSVLIQLVLGFCMSGTFSIDDIWSKRHFNQTIDLIK
jgi:hypothetical protein